MSSMDDEKYTEKAAFWFSSFDSHIEFFRFFFNFPQQHVYELSDFRFPSNWILVGYKLLL